MKITWIGRVDVIEPGQRPTFVSVMEEPSALAKAASSPGRAATAAAASAATGATAAATATTTASATAATTAATPGKLYAALGRRSVLLVEHVERRQAHVGDFFFTKRYLVIQSDGRRLGHIGGRHCRC